jgi:hypothetical protein
MSYICEGCNYETRDLSNFSRHKNSKKHKNNEHKSIDAPFMHHSCTIYAPQKKDIENTNHNVTGNEDHKYVCVNCKKTFAYHQGMYRHMKYYCKRLENKDNKIKILEEQNNKLIDTIQNQSKSVVVNSEIAKKSINTLSYALKHFQDAPPIGLLEDDKFNKMTKYLIYDDNGNKKTNKLVEEIIIFHYNQNTLVKVLGDLIINEYKKNDPNKQSTWSSDVSRLTFIVKDIVGKTKKSKWISDKKGVHVTQTIITPMMKIIRDKLMSYVSKSGKKVNRLTDKSENEEEIKDLLSKMHDANLAILAIKLGKIDGEILKYIAPYFNLTVTSDGTGCYDGSDSDCSNSDDSDSDDSDSENTDETDSSS